MIFRLILFIIGHDVFLLCTRFLEIQAISLENPELNTVAIPLNNLLGVTAVDYYSKTDSIFWVDTLWNTINTAKIDVSYKKFYRSCIEWFQMVQKPTQL